MDGDISFGEFISQSIFATIPPFLIALVWGYLYFKTASLFTPLICHFIWNSTLNMILFITISEQEIGNAIAIAGALSILTGFLSIYLIKILIERWKLPQLEPWSAREPFINV